MRYFTPLFFLLAVACTPPEQVELRDVRNIEVSTKDGAPVLKGEVVLYNPNSQKVKLKEIAIDLLVDGTKSAEIDQAFNSTIFPESEFSIPAEVKLSLSEENLMTTIFGLLGGRKYELHYVGHIRISRGGFTVRIPVNHKEEFKLN